MLLWAGCEWVLSIEAVGWRLLGLGGHGLGWYRWQC